MCASLPFTRVQLCTRLHVPLLSNVTLSAVPTDGFTVEGNCIVVSQYSFPPCVTLLAVKKKFLFPKYKLKMAVSVYERNWGGGWHLGTSLPAALCIPLYFKLSM